MFKTNWCSVTTGGARICLQALWRQRPSFLLHWNCWNIFTSNTCAKAPGWTRSSRDGYALSDFKELTVKTNCTIKHPLSLLCFRTFHSNPNHYYLRARNTPIHLVSFKRLVKAGTTGFPSSVFFSSCSCRLTGRTNVQFFLTLSTRNWGRVPMQPLRQSPLPTSLTPKAHSQLLIQT